MTSQTRSTRSLARRAFKLATDNFATDAAETAEVLKVTTKEASALFKALAKRGLAESTHVNGEKKLTWQTYFNVTDGQATIKEALAGFDAAWPKSAKASPSNGRVGATGPRYTDAQIKKGVTARKAGKGWGAVAEAAGVKSPSYFSTKVREANGGADPKVEVNGERKRSTAKATAKKATKTTGRKRGATKAAKKGAAKS